MAKSKQIRVRVIPRAKQETVTKMGDGRLKVKVNAPAEKGKANLRATELLADHFLVEAGQIRIVAGAKSQEKIVKIISS